QKHSTPRATKGENEKYIFRVWLLRLGFIGDEYKEARKLLLDRLEGNAAFRTEEAMKEAMAKRKTRSGENAVSVEETG
ncbi:MAG: virulence associated protein, partial [Clostridiales bacterium]|nr:virulence associated protein [Clostridiales bacterium]